MDEQETLVLETRYLLKGQKIRNYCLAETCCNVTTS